MKLRFLFLLAITTSLGRTVKESHQLESDVLLSHFETSKQNYYLTGFCCIHSNQTNEFMGLVKSIMSSLQFVTIQINWIYSLKERVMTQTVRTSHHI